MKEQMENLMTIRDYAKNHGVSYECVRKTVCQILQDDISFKKHIQKVGRLRYLDSVAVKCLDSHVKGNKSNYLQKLNEIESLKNQIEELTKKVNELNSQYNSERDKCEFLQESLRTQTLEFANKIYSIAMKYKVPEDKSIDGATADCQNKTDKTSNNWVDGEL